MPLALRELTDRQLIDVWLRSETSGPSHCAGDPRTATVIALRFPLARRHQQLTVEIDELDTLIAPAPHRTDPRPALALLGVGPDVAGQLLVTAGDNPDRLRYEAAFAMLCGAAPLPASSGGPSGTGSTAAATAKPTRALPDRALPAALDPRPAPTPSAAPPKA